MKTIFKTRCQPDGLANKKPNIMKIQTHTNILLGSSLALALTLAAGSRAQAQSSPPPQKADMMGEPMIQTGQSMPEQRRAMMADLKVQDAKLAEQISAMNRAPADKKVDLMAAIVTQMAAQRTGMNVRMEAMHDLMLKNTQMEQGNRPAQPMMQGVDTNFTGEEKNMSPTAMLAEMKAQNDQLNGQITEMNNAPADKKMDLLAIVLTQMAAQRTTAYLRMESMRGEMMQLRQMGKEPMSPDSMMKGMN
jgi:hypothetical protein